MVNNWLSVLPIIACCFLIFALSGCGVMQPRVETVKTPLIVPPSFYVCEDAGPRPTGDVIMESQVAKYIALLEASTKDCKVKLKQLKILVDCHNDSKCDVEKLAEFIGLVTPQESR